MPYLKSFLDSKPKDGYIFIFITFYYPDFDVDAEVDKQLQIDYPELYEVLHHDAKNKPDPTLEDEAYLRQSELRMSILDSVFRPIVLDFCKEDDIKYVNEETYGNVDKKLTFDKLVINLDSYELFVDGKRMEVPPKEMELLYHLASSPNRVFTRNQLLDEVWGFDYFGDSRTVDVHIKRLREKLEGVSDNWSLKTVWGVGYKFELSDS